MKLNSFMRRVLKPDDLDILKEMEKEDDIRLGLLIKAMDIRLKELETKEGDLNDVNWPYKRALADGRRLEIEFWKSIIGENHE